MFLFHSLIAEISVFISDDRDPKAVLFVMVHFLSLGKKQASTESDWDLKTCAIDYLFHIKKSSKYLTPA